MGSIMGTGRWTDTGLWIGTKLGMGTRIETGTGFTALFFLLTLKWHQLVTMKEGGWSSPPAGVTGLTPSPQRFLTSLQTKVWVYIQSNLVRSINKLSARPLLHRHELLWFSFLMTLIPQLLLTTCVFVCDGQFVYSADLWDLSHIFNLI